MKCEMQTAAMEADCTYSIGTGLARARCNPPASPTSFVLTNLWTFTDTDTAGVETILRTYVNSPTAPVPTWCADENAPIPTSDLITPVKIPRSEYGTYELVITAGEEKLRATTGGSVSTSGPQPTGTGSEAASVATSSEAAATGGAGDTGAATSVRGAAPAVAGLGAAIAAYFL
ncbi:hypothetical protein BS50DRAFT_574220 [Corynespora cassiicola Philippines]|uniref:Uncharacterized protein n=1 Tax=Corynespora cassiicola Philippines TaxID=1448308 RepID=A0A2T2NQ56_CORCC|nr:hypothetical protein BS50DRAFT_574220 [Corynespora cassiicola Philippines]